MQEVVSLADWFADLASRSFDWTAKRGVPPAVRTWLAGDSEAHLFDLHHTYDDEDDEQHGGDHVGDGTRRICDCVIASLEVADREREYAPEEAKNVHDEPALSDKIRVCSA